MAQPKLVSASKNQRSQPKVTEMNHRTLGYSDSLKCFCCSVSELHCEAITIPRRIHYDGVNLKYS